MNDYFDDDYEDEKKEYDQAYSKALDSFIKSIDDEDRRALIESELKDMRYNPSKSGSADAELNFLKAKNQLHQKRNKLNKESGGKVDSFLKFKQMADGKSESQVQNWAAKTLRNRD